MTSPHRDVWVVWFIIIVVVIMMLSWSLIPWAIGFKDSVYR